MIDDNEQGDDAFDIQDDFDQDGGEGGGSKLSLKDAWQGNPLLKIGAAVVIAAVAVGAYTTITKPNPIEETKSVIRGVDSRSVETTPGKDVLDKAYTEAVEKKNTQRAEMAAATGTSSLPTPIATAQEGGLVIPQQTSKVVGDPLQEWKNSVQARRIKSEEVNFEEDMAQIPQAPQLVPLVQPVTPQPIQKADPQAAQAMTGQMRTVLAPQTPKGVKTLTVTAQPSAYAALVAEIKESEKSGTSSAKSGSGSRSSASNASSGGSRASGGRGSSDDKIIIPAGNIFYAQLLIDLNSDIPMPVLATVMSGPFTGGRAIGTMAKEDEYLTITYERIIKDDVIYTINGIALDEKTNLPAVQGEVDHHYFDRIFLPVASKFVAGYSEAISDAGTTTTTTAGGGVATENPKKTARESLYEGLSEAATTVSDIVAEDAKTEITIKVSRGTTMGVLVLDNVTTASVGR